jgi:drug/metabolite transporter (DMT)-like permease
MRLALLLALGAATSWGIGGLLLKRGTDVAAATTILAVQYALGVGLLLAWLGSTGGIGTLLETIAERWTTLVVIALFQIGGYVFFVSAVARAGVDSIPTAVAVAISAAYPILIVLLSGPVLDEPLAWNHVIGVLLVVGGVVIAQAL